MSAKGHDHPHSSPESPPRETGSASGTPSDSGLFPPRKYYSTGEVIEHTGLSRQTLHNYKRLGLIQPARWTEGGHCYYDESVFLRLRKIKLFQRYHSLQEIRDLLEAEEKGEPSPSKEQVGASSSQTEPAAPQETAATTPEEEEEARLEAPDANMPDATQWSDNEERAPDLAQELLHARHFPEKLYRIGDLMRLTGYSRQTLHNYTIQGLLQTRDHTASGHRLYGPDAFTVLRLIEVYKRHRRFSEVQTLIEQWYQTRDNSAQTT